MFDVLRHREFLADCYTQRLYFLDSWDGTAGKGLTMARRQLGDKNDLHRLDVIQLQVIWAIPVSDMLYFFCTRPTVRRGDNLIGAIR